MLALLEDIHLGMGSIAEYRQCNPAFSSVAVLLGATAEIAVQAVLPLLNHLIGRGRDWKVQ
jgi:hypothetical protein